MIRPVPLFAVAALACLPSCSLCKPLVSVVTGPVYVLQQPVDYGRFFDDLHHCPEGALIGLGAFWFLSGPICGLVNGVLNDYYLLTGQIDFVEYQHNALDPFATALDPER